jgi:hypothetical protein
MNRSLLVLTCLFGLALATGCDTPNGTPAGTIEQPTDSKGKPVGGNVGPAGGQRQVGPPQ